MIEWVYTTDNDIFLENKGRNPFLYLYNIINLTNRTSVYDTLVISEIFCNDKINIKYV